ncbi:hypothetical protein Ddye_029836 [Dipteronia dyeriana]|uniref:Reverse transcriptase domain-containing protein n=1 Tax=Dipteronia dyeriana TaxID=168575 RepID=A0AAD9TG93_9ROSI|nr:hypothetical protein Ddye_029836 [Dipteronia dyeriana]
MKKELSEVSNDTQLGSWREGIVVTYFADLFRSNQSSESQWCKLVLDDVISENQSAFVPGRLISDNTVITFECSHGLQTRKRKAGSITLKLDMSKAYDRVEWGFLSTMMLKLGFSVAWVEKVMRCVTSVSFSLLVNGDVCGNLRPSRGLRQGDPLSPYLFLICAEGLSCLINDVLSSEKVIGYWCGSTRPFISYLFFVGDSLLLARANNEDCKAIKQTFDVYVATSGQVVNFNKSALCIKDRIWQRVRGSHNRLFSSYGKEILLKDVVQSISTFAISLFWLPNGLIKNIHRLCRWNEQLIRSSFLTDEADAIISLSLGFSQTEDSLLWHFEKSGAYTVKSGYRFGRMLLFWEVPSGSNSINWWKSLWRIQVPLKLAPTSTTRDTGLGGEELSDLGLERHAQAQVNERLKCAKKLLGWLDEYVI